MDTTFLNGVHTLGIVCNQWGDTGKGKFVDYFAADWADIIARGTGGANAGHTICTGADQFVFHLVPSGILHRKLNIIGPGVAVDPTTLSLELEALRRANISPEHLRISLNAKLVLPQHVLLDQLREAAAAPAGNIIGTTGRGMGPAYVDHVARTGLVVNDLLNPDVFARKLRRNLEEKRRIIRSFPPDLVRVVMNRAMCADFYTAKNDFEDDAIVQYHARLGKELSRFITDTDAILQKAAGKKNILLEGAQGNLLSVDYGTYPYVTSSDCSIGGLAKGVGLRERDVDVALGITKAFYMTRVGEGPFPTELGGERSAEHCRISTRTSEAEAYPDVTLNDPDELRLGVTIRKIGNEYGATTGRPRRTGWLDLPIMRYSKGITGPNVVLTKLDVLGGMERLNICTEYVYAGPDYVWGQRLFRAGDRIQTAIPELEIMKHCKPIYATLPGWQQSIRGMRSYEELPAQLRDAICFLEERAGVNVTFLSVGPDRDETIMVHPPCR